MRAASIYIILYFINSPTSITPCSIPFFRSVEKLVQTREEVARMVLSMSTNGMDPRHDDSFDTSLEQDSNNGENGESDVKVKMVFMIFPCSTLFSHSSCL